MAFDTPERCLAVDLQHRGQMGGHQAIRAVGNKDGEGARPHQSVHLAHVLYREVLGRIHGQPIFLYDTQLADWVCAWPARQRQGQHTRVLDKSAPLAKGAWEGGRPRPSIMADCSTLDPGGPDVAARL